MIMRWVGAILVAGGAAAAGLTAIQRLGSHVRLLSALVNALEVMQSEIYFNLVALPELIGQLARRAAPPARPFFAHASKQMKLLGEESFQTLWHKALSETGAEWRTAEKDVLMDLGGLLGRYDSEAQSRAISYAKERMSELLAKAEDERARQSRIYGTLGVACGLAIVIILI